MSCGNLRPPSSIGRLPSDARVKRGCLPGRVCTRAENCGWLVPKSAASPSFVSFSRSFKVPWQSVQKARSEEHTSELQSLMRISYAVFCLKKKNKQNIHINIKRS